MLEFETFLIVVYHLLRVLHHLREIPNLYVVLGFKPPFISSFAINYAMGII